MTSILGVGMSAVKSCCGRDGGQRRAKGRNRIEGRSLSSPWSLRAVECSCRPPSAMTSQGTGHGRFTRAIQGRNVFMAEVALKEMGDPSLLVALDYLLLLCTER